MKMYIGQDLESRYIVLLSEKDKEIYLVRRTIEKRKKIKLGFFSVVGIGYNQVPSSFPSFFLVFCVACRLVEA
jgi:hypothetical protein